MIRSVDWSARQSVMGVLRRSRASAASFCSRRFIESDRSHSRCAAMLMTSADYRESLRRYKPRSTSTAGGSSRSPTSRRCSPGVNALGVTYDYALRDRSSRR